MESTASRVSRKHRWLGKAWRKRCAVAVSALLLLLLLLWYEGGSSTDVSKGDVVVPPLERSTRMPVSTYLSTPSQVLSRPTEKLFDDRKDVLMVPTISGTYLCKYLINATRVPGGCVQSCMMRGYKGDMSSVEFNCHVRSSRHSNRSGKADVIVNHNGPVPQRTPRGRPYLTLFYSGESNQTATKRGNDAYQMQYDMVVSFEHHRPLYFTWTHREQSAFMDIITKNNRGAGPSADAIWKNWHGRLSAAAVFVSRCVGGRGELINNLSHFYPVHSYGNCGRNHRLPSKCKRMSDRYQQKMCVFRNYKYALTVENTKEKDYVTEKIYHGLLSGTVPLYWGAPNVADFTPAGRNSFVDLEGLIPTLLGRRRKDGAAAAVESGELQKLGEYLRHLEQDRTAVGRLFAWRLARHPEEWGGAFLDNLYHTDPICEICAEARRRRGD